jgi:pyridoxal/pyridoxine/pyridoxamine kinase
MGELLEIFLMSQTTAEESEDMLETQWLRSLCSRWAAKYPLLTRYSSVNPLPPAFGVSLSSIGNHLGYGQAKGTRATASEISDLYQGLRDSYLDSFDMMLSGYLPGAAAVEAVGTIARDLKYKATMKPGSFFWVLDPVMGDNGKLYVAEDVVPAYKALIKDADLILPNQFEAE